jgi:Skp family chaperone for outer membrane proteins
MTKFHQFGWLLAACLAGMLFAGGFQDASSKVGVVDLAKIVEGSNFGKQNQETFAQLKKAREDLLEFIDTNRVLTNEQATQIRDLSLKPNRSNEENAQLERVKAEVVAAFKRWQELSTKPNMSAEERMLVEEYARRSQTMNEVAQRWFREFTTEMQTWADRQKVESVRRARVAISEVAKAQGFTVVFEVGVAPYGANDLSDAALQSMNAQRP